MEIYRGLLGLPVMGLNAVEVSAEVARASGIRSEVRWSWAVWDSDSSGEAGEIPWCTWLYHQLYIEAIHGTGIMTESYTPKHCFSRTAQNIIKIMIVFWSFVTPLAICDTFCPILTSPHDQLFLQDVQRYLPFFNYPTLCGWYEGNRCWQPVHFTLVHRLSPAIFYPVGVTPDIAKLTARRLKLIVRKKSIVW